MSWPGTRSDLVIGTKVDREHFSKLGRQIGRFLFSPFSPLVRLFFNVDKVHLHSPYRLPAYIAAQSHTYGLRRIRSAG